MTDGRDRPEFFPLQIHGCRGYACIGAFDLLCKDCETFAARLASEVSFNVHR